MFGRQKMLVVGVFVMATGVQLAGCSCAEEPPAAAVPAADAAPVDVMAPAAVAGEEPGTSPAVDPRPGPFVRGVRGGPLLRLGVDHSGELVIKGDTVTLHVIHRSRKTVPATGEVALHIKPKGADDMHLVMTPAADGTRWTTKIPFDPGEAEAVVTMQIAGETVTGAIVWAEAEGGPPPPKSVSPPIPNPVPVETP